VEAYALYATSLILLTTSNNNKGNDDIVAGGGGGGGVACDEEGLTEAIHNVQYGRRRIHTAILRSLNHHFQMKEPHKNSSNQQQQQSQSSDGALDDTTGWRALETNLNALACYIDVCVGTAVTNTAAGIDANVRYKRSSVFDKKFTPTVSTANVTNKILFINI
jgi:hypothetical protein